MLQIGEKTLIEESDPDTDDWKILVYDKLGRDVISPLLKIGDLKASSVTLHLLINSPRQPIPDVPAVYFVEPTEENVKRICQDLRNRMYETYYLNFLSPLPRTYLEEIAQVSLETDTYNQIAKIFDQYQNFICLEPRLFTLNMPNVFYDLNNPSSVDAEIEEAVERIAEALFSVVVTSEDVPIIRCPKGEAAEMISHKLDQKIKSQLFNQKNPLFNENLSLSRPLFVIVDRSIDLQTMLAHNWTYQAMVHDVFDMKLNKLSIQTSEGKKSYDLDVRDFFWAASSNLSFPQVAGFFF